jgi:hypothetical protein
MAYCYDHLNSERASGGTYFLVEDLIYSSAVHLHSPLQASAVNLNLPSLSFIICIIYIPWGVPVAQTDVTYLS